MNGREAPDAGPLLLGVRHHGPGSARAVRAALDGARPRVVLIEGPPEADPLIPLAAQEDMRPPVALLAHAVDEPGRSAFWPLAAFSPEWVALRWALEHGVPARFIDLPATHTLAWEREEEEGREERRRRPARSGAPGPRTRTCGSIRWGARRDRGVRRRRALVGGRRRTPGRGQGRRARAVHGPGGGDDGAAGGVRQRRTRPGPDPRGPYAAACPGRAAEFEDGVAVVCGAWHVPALRHCTTVAADRALLKGLPRVKTDLTWVPWTHRRLSRAGGYGAGVASRGGTRTCSTPRTGRSSGG